MFTLHVFIQKDCLFPGTKSHLFEGCLYPAVDCVCFVKHLRLKVTTGVQSNLVGVQ